MMENKIKCVILEDEQHTSRLMVNYVSKIQQLDLVGVFLSPIELLNFKGLKEVQIIYLDIQMPDMTGLDFLKSNCINAEVIITTAYSEHALEGYELNVIDYLLKPVELPRFIQATQKAIEQILLKHPSKIIQQFLDVPNYLMLKVDKKIVKVLIKDIVYIQSDWNYIHVYTKNQKYMVLSTMKSIEESLEEFSFIRIHKSYLINLDYFEFIESNQIQVNGVKLQVSRKYKAEVMKVLL